MDKRGADENKLGKDKEKNDGWREKAKFWRSNKAGQVRDLVVNKIESSGHWVEHPGHSVEGPKPNAEETSSWTEIPVPNHMDCLGITCLAAFLTTHSKNQTNDTAHIQPSLSRFEKSAIDMINPYLKSTKETLSHEEWRERVLWPVIQIHRHEAEKICRDLISNFDDEDKKHEFLDFVRQGLPYTLFRDVQATGKLFWHHLLALLKDGRFLPDIIIEWIFHILLYDLDIKIDHYKLQKKEPKLEDFMEWFREPNHGKRRCSVTDDMVENCLRTCADFRKFTIEEAEWTLLEWSNFPKGDKEWSEQVVTTLRPRAIAFESILVILPTFDEEYLASCHKEMQKIFEDIKLSRTEIHSISNGKGEVLIGLAQFFDFLEGHSKKQTLIAEQDHESLSEKACRAVVRRISSSSVKAGMVDRMKEQATSILINPLIAIFLYDYQRGLGDVHIKHFELCSSLKQGTDLEAVKKNHQEDLAKRMKELDSLRCSPGDDLDRLHDKTNGVRRMQYYLKHESSPGQPLAGYFHWAIAKGIQKWRNYENDNPAIRTWAEHVESNETKHARDLAEIELLEREDRPASPSQASAHDKKLFDMRKKHHVNLGKYEYHYRNPFEASELKAFIRRLSSDDELKKAGFDDNVREIWITLLPFFGDARFTPDSTTTWWQFIIHHICIGFEDD